jgi:uncharacterized membrane protein
MICWILQKIYQQNQWYDSLADTNGTLRFLLFLTPMLAGFTLDLYWVILFGGTPVFTYLVWVLMALWRATYIIRQKRRR